MDLVERLRNRVNDSPMPAEHLLDEAAEAIEGLVEVLEGIAGARDLEGVHDYARGWNAARHRIRREARTAIAKVKGDA